LFNDVDCNVSVIMYFVIFVKGDWKIVSGVGLCRVIQVHQVGNTGSIDTKLGLVARRAVVVQRGLRASLLSHI